MNNLSPRNLELIYKQTVKQKASDGQRTGDSSRATNSPAQLFIPKSKGLKQKNDSIAQQMGTFNKKSKKTRATSVLPTSSTAHARSS